MSRPISVGCKSPKDLTPLCYEVNVKSNSEANLIFSALLKVINYCKRLRGKKIDKNGRSPLSVADQTVSIIKIIG